MTRNSWLPRKRSGVRCAHCGKHIFKDGQPHDYYMVCDELWEAHGVGFGLLCFHCFEASLGRSLTIEDFEGCSASANAWLFVLEREASKPDFIPRKVPDWAAHVLPRLEALMMKKMQSKYTMGRG